MLTINPKGSALRAAAAALCLAGLTLASTPAMAAEAGASSHGLALAPDQGQAQQAPTAAGPSGAPATSKSPWIGGGTSFADLPEPIEVTIVVSLSVVAGVMLQRIKRAALGETQDTGARR